MFSFNKKTAIMIGLLILILLGLIYLVINPKKTTPPPQAIPVFSPSPNPSASIGPLPGQSYTYSSEADAIKRKQGEAISQLIKKLPFKGSSFSLEYSFENIEFIAVLNSDNLTAANQELDQFLKDNGIADRNWFNNLTIK